MNKILVVGSSNTDMVIQASRFPLPGETVMGADFLMNPWWKRCPSSYSCKAIGGDVMFVGRIGNDIFGQQSITLMKEAGIDKELI